MMAQIEAMLSGVCVSDRDRLSQRRPVDKVDTIFDAHSTT
jgi:hypothetical protein